MRSPLARHVAASALTFSLLGAVAGCTATPGAPGPAPTSTAAPSSAPTTPPPATPKATETATQTFGAFTAAQLSQIGIDATTSAFAPDVAFDAAKTRIERRMVAPEWLVLVPATSAGYAAEAQCTIGGSPGAPELGLSSASIQRLPEEQIQNLIRGENEGGD